MLEEGITEIGEHTFFGCNALKTIGYPTTLTTIGRSAFRGCKNLTHTNLPANLIKIGQESFAENKFTDNKNSNPPARLQLFRWHHLKVLNFKL